MWKSSKGAALVEYAPLLAMVAIALPGLFFLGSQVPELFEEPGPFTPPDDPVIELVVPDCVMNAQCDIPPPVLEYCLDNTVSGETCPIIPYLVLDPVDPLEPTILVPENVTDPQLSWVMEDLDLGVYANRFGGTAANDQDIATYSGFVAHPAGNYCQSRGAMLPSQAMLFEMAPYAAELNLVNNIYWSSSQFWAAGGYNPPPVLTTLAYVKNFSVSRYNASLSPDGHGFLTARFYVRCVWGA